MGVISRYFQRLATILRPKRTTLPTVSADAEGLWIGSEQVTWGDLSRLDAYKIDIYVGDILCLGILGSGGRIFEINEESPGWKDVGDAIEQFLPGSLPHAEWMLQLIAARPGESVAIYSIVRSG